MKKIMFVFLLCVGGVLTASAKTIAFWPFGAEGGRDATGQGNDLEYDANVQIGETAVLNGKHTLFSTKNALDLSCTKSITVEFWTKFNASENPEPVMLMELSEQMSGSTPNSFYIDFAEKAGALLAMGYANNYSGADDNAENHVGDGEWHHVAFIFDSTINSSACTTLYVDGTKVYTTSTVGNNAAGNQRYFPANKKLYIGSRNNAQFRFSGELDNIRISTGRLAPEQFIDRDGTVPQVAPLAYWPFGSAGIADMSGNGNDLIAPPAGRLANGAASFDGTGLPLGTRLPVDLRGCTETGFTAEFWMRLPPEAATNTQILLEHSADSSVSQEIGSTFYIAANDMSAKMASVAHLDAGGFKQYHVDKVPYTDVADGQWHHVAFVYDPTAIRGPETYRLYLDHVQQAQDSRQDIYGRSNLVSLANSEIFIGGRRRVSSKNVNYIALGDIDDVRLTACPLSPEQFLAARTAEDAQVLGWWRFDRGVELSPALANGISLVAEGSVSFANGSAVLCGGSLAAATAFDLTDVTALTAECFVKVEGTWRHLVKVWNGAFDGGPASVTLDGAAVEPSEWANVLVLAADGGFTAAAGGFAGEIDDVRVTAAALTDATRLASRSDDTPRVLAHWHFDSMPGYRDEHIANNLELTIPNDPTVDICDWACRFSRGMGLKTRQPLLLSHWNALTIECFARFKPGEKGNIFELGDDYNDHAGTFCFGAEFLDNTGPGFGFRCGDGYNIRTRPSRVTDGDWHHYVCVLEREGTQVKTAFYVDGVAMSNFSGGYAKTGWAAFLDAYLYLGTRWSYGIDKDWDKFPAFVGDLDELRIVNGALKPEEMMKLDDRRNQTTKTIAHWSFDGDTPLVDKSGNGHDLTGNADIGDGAATFGANKALKTASALPLSGCRQVTVEMIFRAEDLTHLTILFETSANYGNKPGSIASYLNGDGSLDTVTWKLARQSDKSSVTDSNWHRLVVLYDMDADVDEFMYRCRGYLDGAPVDTRCLANDVLQLKANANFCDEVLYLGSRAGTGYWFGGQMKEVRISEGIVPAEDQLKFPITETADHVVAFWPFSRQWGALVDASGNGHDLAAPASGVTFEKGCADFAAGHSELRTTGKVDFTRLDAFTVECFVRAPLGSLPMAILGSCKSYAERQTGFNFSSTTNGTELLGVSLVVCGGLKYRNENKSSDYKYAGQVLKGGYPFDGKWHHMALVVDRTVGAHGRESYYFDRQLVRSADLPHVVALPSTPLAIGSVLGVADGSLVGQVDDVRISSVARTPETFLQHRTSDAGCLIIVR